MAASGSVGAEKKDLSYSQLVSENRSTLYLDYYLCVDFDIVKQTEHEKYKKIYSDTQKKFQSITLDVFEKFATEWLSDVDMGDTVAGPDFFLSVATYLGTADQPPVLPDDWFVEAAIRDMILDIMDNHNIGVFNLLAMALKKNKVI